VETWHILVYTAGAIAGTLAGIVCAAISYYLLSRFAFKEDLSLPQLIHFVLTARFFTLPSVSLTRLAPFFNRIRQSFLTRKEHLARALPGRKLQKPVVPVEAEVERLAPVETVEESLIPVQIQDPVTVQVPIHDSTPVQQFIESLPAITQVERPPEEPASDLFAELEYNIKIAREFSGENLVPLRTDVWDTCSQAVNNLPGKLQSELENIYATIKILNNLVWFSTEFHRQSPALSEEYGNLLTAIAGKLNSLTDSQSFTLPQKVEA
jgi:hypothetical protein